MIDDRMVRSIALDRWLLNGQTEFHGLQRHAFKGHKFEPLQASQCHQTNADQCLCLLTNSPVGSCKSTCRCNHFQGFGRDFSIDEPLREGHECVRPFFVYDYLPFLPFEIYHGFHADSVLKRTNHVVEEVA